MYITIDEDYFKQIEDELTPLGMSGLYQDEDGNLVSVEPADSESDTTEKKDRPPLAQKEPDRTDPNYWYFVYDPRYCGGSREDYCERMAAKYRTIEIKEKYQKETTREEARKKAIERERKTKEVKTSRLNLPLWIKKLCLNVFLWFSR